MKKVYESSRVVLFHGWAEDFLSQAEPDFADLLLTDPPYGQGFKSRRADNFTEIKGDDGTYDPFPVIAESLRLMRRYRHAYVFGPLDLTPLVTEGLIQAPVELIWDKSIMGSGSLAIPWGPAHEPIQFCNAVRSRANVEKGEGKLTARIRRGSVLRHQRAHAAGAKRHPSEKPVSLLRELIESSSTPGEVVFDPFVGSGSTLVAAILEGRKGIGIELDEQYIPLARKRLEKAEDVAEQMVGI